MKVYVTMTAGKVYPRIKKLIFTCTSQEAEIVEQNGLAKGHKFVNICIKKPYFSDKYFPIYLDRQSNPEWYKIKAF